VRTKEEIKPLGRWKESLTPEEVGAIEIDNDRRLKTSKPHTSFAEFSWTTARRPQRLSGSLWNSGIVSDAITCVVAMRSGEFRLKVRLPHNLLVTTYTAVISTAMTLAGTLGRFPNTAR
jgi:hypothetical protein